MFLGHFLVELQMVSSSKAQILIRYLLVISHGIKTHGDWATPLYKTKGSIVLLCWSTFR